MSLRIAFYDSGVGGLPYLEMTKKLLPHAEFIYLADSAHFPLGEKPLDEVRSIVTRGARGLLERGGADIVVIACNTASVAALSEVRKAFPKGRFVGTVPAIKPAAERTKSGKIALFATERTVTDAYTLELVRKHAPGLDVRLIAAPDWVRFVETEWLGSEAGRQQEVVRARLEPELAAGVDEVILACTHFLYLEPAARAVAGERAEVIDSIGGVSRRVAELAAKVAADAGAGERRAAVLLAPGFYSSNAELFETESQFASRFGLAIGGIWK
jgi:glutamate racemase